MVAIEEVGSTHPTGVLSCFSKYLNKPGADPGFPVGGGANPPGGAPTYDFAKFCEKLSEIEKILGRRGGARRVRPPKSATANSEHS